MDVDVSTSVAGNKPQRIRRIQGYGNKGKQQGRSYCQTQGRLYKFGVAKYFQRRI